MDSSDPELKKKNMSPRIMELVSPIGKGQKSINCISHLEQARQFLLQSIAHSIEQNHEEVYLIVLLIDERPEEVTDMQRTVKRSGSIIHF